MNSSGSQPLPMPRSSRPPDSTSTVAACLASSSGDANGWQTVATPSRIEDVAAARNPSETSGSSTLRYTGAIRDPAGISSRWNVHSDR